MILKCNIWSANKEHYGNVKMKNNIDILCPGYSKIYEIVPDIIYPIRSSVQRKSSPIAWGWWILLSR